MPEVEDRLGALEDQGQRAAQAISLTQEEINAANAELADLKNRIKTDTPPNVPLGTILDWLRLDGITAIPDGYHLCDGSLITDADSPFNGKAPPDLTNCFLMGVPQANIGERGGSNTINLQHSHNYNGATGGVGTAGATHLFGGDVEIAQAGHVHGYSGTTDVHLSPTTDNRPLYLGVLKIMRIK